jgi:RND family efflux transporter MFP subunit
MRGVVLVGLVAIGCAKPPKAVPVEPPKVTVGHPVEQEVQDYTDFNGWLEAAKTVEIRSRVRGHIDKVHFKDGQIVKEGDLLFTLDPRPFEAEVAVAKSQIEVARAQLQFELEEEKRNQGLFDKKVVTEADLQKVIASRKSWDAKLIAAEEDARRRELDLTYSKIVAPISGKIGRAQLVEGNLVGAGGSDPLLTTIVSIDPIHAYFHADENSLLRFRRDRAKLQGGEGRDRDLDGDLHVPFQFSLEIETGFPHQGEIDFAENRIDPETGTIEVRGTIANPNGVFVPGSRVHIRAPNATLPQKSLLIPDSAILSDQDRRYVLEMDDKKIVVRRDVQLGRLLDDGQRVILPGEHGLTQASWIIIDGLQRARVNYPVEPVDSQGDAVIIAATH